MRRKSRLPPIQVALRFYPGQDDDLIHSNRNLTEKITIQITRSMLADLQNVATKSGKPLAEIVRQAIRLHDHRRLNHPVRPHYLPHGCLGAVHVVECCRCQIDWLLFHLFLSL